MTAIFMARSPNGIVATADAAFYDQDGTLSHLATKLILMPEHDCIITLQGPYLYHAELRARLRCVVGGFDDVLSLIVDASAEIYMEYENGYGFSRAFAMLIGGYSTAREAWETYWLHSEPYQEGSEHRPYEAWTLTPAFATAWVPSYGRQAAIDAGLNPDEPLNRQGMGVDEIGIRIIGAARREPIAIGGDKRNGCCQVGGFIQHATLQRGYAATVIAHRWPDSIGEKLDPARGELLPALIQG